MAATKEDIRGWIKAAPETATHMIVMCDTYDYDDYPVYVHNGEDSRKIAAEHTKPMQKVMECYDLSMDTEAQLRERRAYHW